jgi:HAD superfamily hydrolase (TIGR01490 family)
MRPSSDNPGHPRAGALVPSAGQRVLEGDHQGGGDDRAMTQSVRPLTALAAIDVDGTLFAERASQHAFLSILRAAGLLDRRAFGSLLATYVLHRAALIDDETARRRGLALLDGLPLARAHAFAEQLSARLLPRVRHEALAEIARLRARGLHVMLASASLDLVVGRLAEKLGVDGYLASALLVVDDRCRGAFAGEVLEGHRKWSALQEFADGRFGPQGWHLAAAYGDSASDVPLLEHAEQAIAVNAKPALARTARQRGWRQVAWS